jgi:hypothetical protein
MLMLVLCCLYPEWCDSCSSGTKLVAIVAVSGRMPCGHRGSVCLSGPVWACLSGRVKSD